MRDILSQTTAIVFILGAVTAGLTACVAPLPLDPGRMPDAVTAPHGEPTAAPQSDDTERPAGWTEASHSNDVDPNYDVVFPRDVVNTLTITIAPEDWATMQADMEEIYGEERDRERALAEMTEEERAAEIEKRMAEIAAAGENQPRAAEFTRPSPMWVPATVSFQGQEWTHVGVRYKGASSLSPWKDGEMKLPFKFDFDEFEDDYPEIDNQRFFGFKQLSLANNYGDPSGLRDTVVYELLEEAGLPSMRTAPYEVVLDYGEGPVRLGLYTVIEVVDDTGIPSYFGSDDGNIYEGAGYGSTLAEKHADILEESFEKKNNEDAADWSDIRALYDVLHSEQRTTDPAAWRADLEAIFHVDNFLEWLAISAVVGNIDTYGSTPHNFYLYNDPETGQLTWVSWDHNLTFGQEMLAIFKLDKAYVTDTWPLIRYLLDDPVYWDRYVEFMAENDAGALAPDALLARIQNHAELIAPVAMVDMTPEEYEAEVQEIVDFVEARAAEIDAFLAEHGTASSPTTNDTMADDSAADDSAAGDSAAGEAAAGDGNNRPASWTEASHSNDVDPNYDVVFPRDAVNTMTITFAPDDWAAMQADLEELYGQMLWLREAILAAGPDLTMAEREALIPQLFAERASTNAAAEPDPAQADSTPSDRNPMWVPATISFRGQEWTHVGVRYKGASSLLDRWLLGDPRLPLKFDFDEFEDDYPEIKNQRFFGFKQLSLANNYRDPAGMRDTIVYEILEEAGLPSMRSAPYEIVLDYGEGPIRLGLYTMVEVVDSSGIPTYFGSDDGNIYEGDGFGAALTAEHVDKIQASFQKKNNEDEEDWSDVMALYDILNDDKRTSDPAAWRADLEAVFEIDSYLEWLGIAAAVGHGDTYGFFAHNFYLYNDPKTGRLNWISWDHNLTLQEDPMRITTLDKSDVTESWPLIRYLLDDPVYRERYVEFMAENDAGALAPEALIARIQNHAEVIAPVATADMSPEEYEAEVQVILDFVEARAAEIQEFLAGQG